VNGYLLRGAALDPLDANMQLMAAEILASMGRREEALRKLQQGIELAPVADSYGRRASTVHKNLGNHFEAIQNLKIAYDLDPHDFTYPLGISMSFLALGERNVAERWMNVARDISPRHDWVFERRSWLYLANRNLDALEGLVEDWAAVNPEAALVAPASLKRFRASQLEDEERNAESLRMTREAFNDYSSFLEQFQRKDELQVSLANVVPAARSVIAARRLGEGGITDEIMEPLMRWTEQEQSPWATPHGVIVCALEGNRERALDHLRVAVSREMNALWSLDT